MAYLGVRLASGEPLTWWFQIEPSLLRSSGVRRTYWLVSIVLPWKSQRGMELEPTPVGRVMGIDRCVNGHGRTGLARGRKPTELPCSGEWASSFPTLCSLALTLHSFPAPGLTLVGLDK